MRPFSLVQTLLALPIIANAAVVTYDLELTWVLASPDGFERPVIGANHAWPLPIIYATINDTLVVNVKNSLGNQTASLHWHGMFQNGTTNMDGSAQVSHCAIPIGGSLTYNFTIAQPGTYWYHSHVGGQYPDGMRAPLIVHDPNNPYKDQYDEEIIISFSDWYHDQTTYLTQKFLSLSNPTGAEPIPDTALMNDTTNLRVNIQPGKTYFIRMVNIAAFVPFYVWFEDHDFTIIEVDGVYTEAANASEIYIAVAQRYGVLLTTKNSTDKNYPIIAAMDQDLLDVVPDTLQPNVTGWLVYDQAKELPVPADVDEYDPFDDFTLVPADQQPLLENPDMIVNVTFEMQTRDNGANYALINSVSYVPPKVPTIFTALTTGDNATNPLVYGHTSNTWVLERDHVIEVVLNNNDPGKHPFHLHGHNFQVISRAPEESGLLLDGQVDNSNLPAIPVKRDTILVYPESNLRLRFVADNPGIWLFHCHIEWHVISGLSATFVEAPLALQNTLQIPADQYAACQAQGIATAGNAAGNTRNVLDLSGESTDVAPLPAGFEPRGIVALVFSCVSAFLGLAVIAWYGAVPLKRAG